MQILTSMAKKSVGCQFYLTMNSQVDFADLLILPDQLT